MILTPKKSTCEMFFAKLFEISETAKAIHLQQKSKNGFVHSAMGDLYDKASGLADKIYETYCGLYGTCVISFGSKPSDTEPLAYVKACYNYIDSNRSIFKESFIQNNIDEVQSLLAHTMYKLQNVQ